MRVPVKNLLGVCSTVVVPDSGTVADLAASLAGGSAPGSGVRLYFGGVELAREQPLAEALADLGTRAGSHVIMLPGGAGRKGGRGRGAPLGSGGPHGPKPSAPTGGGGPAGEAALAAPHASGFGSPQSPPPQPSRRAGGTPIGVGALDTLLPGFASRPNPSPTAAKRGGARGSSAAASPAAGGPDARAASIQAGDAANSRRQAAVGGGGGSSWDIERGAWDGPEYVDADGGFGFLADEAELARGPRDAEAACDDMLGATLGLAPSRRHQGRTLLQQQLVAMSEAAAASGGGDGGGAGDAPGLQPAQQGVHTSGLATTSRPPLPPRSVAAAARAASSAWAEMAAEFGGGGSGGFGGGTPMPLRDFDMLHAAEAAAGAGVLPQTAGLAQEAVPCPMGGAPAAAAVAGPSGSRQPAPLGVRLHRGELLRAEAAALDALPLPASLERLCRAFSALAAWQGFLLRSHMAATWANSRDHLHGLLPLDDITAADVLLMGELAPHCLAVLEAAPEVAAALDMRHPLASGAEINAFVHRLASAAGTLATDAAEHSTLVQAAVGRPGEDGHDAAGAAGQQAGAAEPPLLADDVLLLFEMPDPGPASSKAATMGQQAAGSGGNGPAGRGAGSRRGLSRAGGGPALARTRKRGGGAGSKADGAHAQQQAGGRPASAPAGGGGDGPPLAEEGQTAQQAEVQEAQRAGDCSAAAAPDPPLGTRGPPRPAGHVGKKALARRSAAFRRAMAFHLLAVHSRFMAALGAARTAAGNSSSAGGIPPMAAAGSTPAGVPAAPAWGASSGSHPPTDPEAAAVPRPRPLRSAAAAARARVQQQLAVVRDGDPAEAAGPGLAQPGSRASPAPAVAQPADPPSGGQRRRRRQQPGPQPVNAEAEEPAPKRRRGRGGAQAAAARKAPGSPPSTSSLDWDPLERGDWAPAFDADTVPLRALRTVAREYAAWLARELRLTPDAAGRPESAGVGGGGGGGGGQAPAAPPRVVKRHERCSDTTHLGPATFLRHLAALPWYDGQLAHTRDVPARPARHAAPAAQLAPAVVAALAARGIHAGAAAGGREQAPPEGVARAAGTSGSGGGSGRGLFTHQAAAIDALLLCRSHTVVCTATASGKSACYNVPVLQALAEDACACALYMFPTKALAQDQLAALRGMVTAAFGPQAASIVQTYDGDTPQADRADVRAAAQLLITNPDMLHTAILPAHTAFARILANLRYVVVDEGHAYHGAFGAHTALVLRRLRRLCARAHGSDPLFVVTSATMANPHHHARALLGLGPHEALEVVDADGSPAGPKLFALWNPPLTPDAKAALRAGEAGLTRTEGRAVGRSSYRARRQQMRLELREANAMRRRGVSVVRGMSEAEWQAAVRLASGKRLLTQCLFDFRYHAGDRPDSLDLLPAANSGGAAGSVGGSGGGGGSAASSGGSRSGVDGARAAHRGLQEGADAGAERAAAAASEGAAAAACAANGSSGCEADPLVAELFQLLRSAGIPVREEPLSDGDGDREEGSAGEEEEPGLQPPRPLWRAGTQGAPAGMLGRGGRLPAMAPQLPANRLPQRSAAEAARRAALASAAEAAVSAAREVPGGPAHMASLAYEAEQQTITRLLTAHDAPATAAGAAAAPAPILPGGSGGTSSGFGGAGAPPEVQAAIQAALPPRGAIFERHGAAGTSTDQKRESPIVETSLLLAEAVQHGLRTIAFCKTRKLSEMVAKYTTDTLRLTAPSLANAVRVYRSGYTPAERRAVEAGLHSGELWAVAATNALELGVDVGHLDLTLHLGFPGSVASLWQQAGRAGRREQQSLSLVVCFDGPLDQHFIRHPDELFLRPIEAVQVDPANARLLRQHLACAAAELPLLPAEDGLLFGGAELLAAATRDLLAAGLLARHARAMGPGAAASVGADGGAGGSAADTALTASLHYSGPGRSPAPRISLRTIDPERYVIHDTAGGRVLEEVEANKAFYVIYDGAIYLHQGQTYVCTSLDLHQRVARVRPTRVKHYTSVQDVMDVHVTGSKVAYPTAHEALAAIAARRGSGGVAVKREIKVEPKVEVKEEGGGGGGGGGGGVAGHAPKAEPGVKEEADAGYDGAGGGGSRPVGGMRAAGEGGRGGSVGCSDGASSGGDGSGDESADGCGTPCSSAACESCYVTVRFLGYHRVSHGTREILDSVELFLPDAQWETQASYVRLPPGARARCRAAGVDFREAVHAAAHALLNILPLYMVCNATDVGTECDNPYDTRYRPERLLLYDKHPGGIGLAAQATPLWPELLRRALDLVEECPCAYQRGCPGCVQHLECKNYNAVLSKRGAVIILNIAIEHEEQHAAALHQRG